MMVSFMSSLILWKSKKKKPSEITPRFQKSKNQHTQKCYKPKDEKKIKKNEYITNAHCTAIVLVRDDVYVGHTTWDDYVEATFRDFKTYQFGWYSNKVQMSSYPGCLSSTDDFYVITDDSHTVELTVMETSIIITKKNILRNIKMSKLPFFYILMYINFTSKSGENWKDLFLKNDLLTHTSQWIVVDFKKYKKSDRRESDRKESDRKESDRKEWELQDGLLYIIENLPDNIQTVDATDDLRKCGHWSSVNLSVLDAEYVVDENEYNQSDSNRNNLIEMIINMENMDIYKFSCLMQRDIPRDGDIDDIRRNSISSRNDLSELKINNGGIDSKIINNNMIKNNIIYAISGPTRECADIFDTSINISTDNEHNLWMKYPHIWNHEYQEMTLEGMKRTDMYSRCLAECA
eukprot:GHVL01044027.1.p1 GENE.GHVL01044027.1~~GHVL01044027.1.p1  ORF type:complete len:405 (+),score=118.94 GHVL01044027.1:635-1849(+)